jgi:hypothetical protein
MERKATVESHARWDRSVRRGDWCGTHEPAEASNRFETCTHPAVGGGRAVACLLSCRQSMGLACVE